MHFYLVGMVSTCACELLHSVHVVELWTGLGQVSVVAICNLGAYLVLDTNQSAFWLHAKWVEYEIKIKYGSI